ncbi:MAG: IPT/TIG domain-containing protein [bacterium]|jgi:hypothetical protein
MYPFLKKISTKKKTVAFVLSLMLLMTILEPQPVQAEGDKATITEAYRLDSESEDKDRTVPTFGGCYVVVEGEHFKAGLELLIGNKPAQNIRVDSSQRITAIAPRDDTIGGKEITVINPHEQPASLPSSANTTLQYRKSKPEITSIDPNYGSTAGGTRVTIRGKEFDNWDTHVEMGQGFAEVTSVSDDHTTLVIGTPKGNVGHSNITITNPDGSTTTRKEGFEYIITPTISHIMPTFGPTSGGTEVTIRGTNFPQNVGVRIAGQDADIIEGHTDTVVIIMTPEGPFGPVDVEVYDKDNPQKSVTRSNGFTYKQETSAPTIADIVPNVGDVKGGEEIVITGSDFLDGDENNPIRVLIDGRDCARVDVDSANRIRAITPAGQAGWRPVEVINPDGGKVRINYGFQYKIPDKLLLITGVTPNRGPVDEKKRVVISGANFLDSGEEPGDVDVEVSFGGRPGGKPVVVVDGEGHQTINVTTPLGGALGPQTVQVLITREVTNEDGSLIIITESAELPNGYTYEPPKKTLVVNKVVNPETETAEGPLDGGVVVYIYGYHFEARQELLPEVCFGENEAVVLEVDIVKDPDDEEESIPLMYIKAAIPPAKAPGMVSVRVVNPPLEGEETRSEGVLEKGFNYRGNLLHLEAVTPAYGPIGGGTLIEITGKNFDWSQNKRIREEKTKVYVGQETAEIRSIEISKVGMDAIWAITPEGKVGPQDIRVSNPFGEVVIKGAFSYYDKLSQPKIEKIEPHFASSKGGTVLTLVGTEVTSGVKVYVGNNPALQVDVINLLDDKGEPVRDEESGLPKKRITCLVPAGEPGPAQIRVVNTDGGECTIDGQFIYLSAPEITSVNPVSGTVEGGTWVVLRGKGFLDAKTVTEYAYYLPDELKPEDLTLQVKFSTAGFNQEAGQVVFLSPTEVAVKTPAGPYVDKNAEVDIEFINPDALLDSGGRSGRAFGPKGYEYRVPTSRPEIKSLDPTFGPVEGGTKVVITGSDFREDASVFFKWKPSAKVTRIDYNTLEVITPPVPANWVDEKDGVDVIVINTQDGGQSQSGKFHYVYPRTRPEFRSIVPNQGSVDGGTLVIIRGYDFGNIEEVESDEPEDEDGNGNGIEPNETKDEDGNGTDEETKTKLVLPTIYFGNEKVAANDVELNPERTILRVKTPPHAPGTVDVRIMNPDSATVTANNAYTYRYVTTEPRIQSVEPKQGRASGGTPVVIAGSGFSTGAKVYFNDQAARVDTAKSSETTLFVYSPPGKVGEKADIAVLNPDGASDTVTEAFSYIRDPQLQPRITQVIPNKGPVTGGILVDIWGVNLKHKQDHQLTVLLGHQPVSIVDWFPDPDQDKASQGYMQRVQIEVPPAEKPGPVDVSAINADGGVFTVPGGFTYTEVTEPIEIDSIVPSMGPYLVTIPAQINGSGFLSGAKVFLGGQEIAGCEVINQGTAVALAIPAAPKREEDLSLDVVVMNPNGATARLKDGFTYVAEPKSKPSIEQVVPNSGRTSGGTPVVVHGQGFVDRILADGPQEAPALFFGDRLAAKTTFLSVEQLAAITPPGPVGPVNVTVINPDGAMAKLISGFIYEDKPGPVITSINPTHGPSAGGTNVVIAGSQFDLGIEVLFGAAPVRSVQRKSDTELVVVTPEGDLGAVDVTVTNPDGSSYTLPDAFTYVGPPKPPEGLEARAVSANSIELRWLPAIGAASYEIYAGESRSDQYFLASASGKTYGVAEPKADEPMVLYYYAQDLEPDTRYYFSVRAVNKDGVSDQTWTASARTLKRSYTEPEFVPAATDFTIAGGGASGAVIIIPPAVLKNSRIRLDLMKPEHENTRSFTIVVPAAEADRDSTIYLAAPKLKLELPIRAVNSVEVRSLSQREREQASIYVTVEEAWGSEATGLLRRLPAGRVVATPIYRLSARLSSGGREKELAWLNERVALTTSFDFAQASWQQPTLYYFDPTRDSWTAAGYFTTWSADAVLDRPGFWVVLSQPM